MEPVRVPQLTWFHIVVDFVMGLPNSGGYNTILVAINKFSKACKLEPLRGLPTAMETAMTSGFQELWSAGGHCI